MMPLLLTRPLALVGKRGLCRDVRMLVHETGSGLRAADLCWHWSHRFTIQLPLWMALLARLPPTQLPPPISLCRISVTTRH